MNLRHAIVAALAVFAGGCDQIQRAVGQSPTPEPARVEGVTFEYRVVSVQRAVNEYRSLGTKSVVFSGTIEFLQAGELPPGNYLLIGKLRTQEASGTEERDLFILIERGRGEYEGTIAANYEFPVRDPTPELRPDQIGFVLTGVVPLQEAELTRIADSVQQSNAAQTPPAPPQE